MSFLPEGASFEERVQELFLAVRGSGLMLSALDVELLEGWGERGVPFEVVARGIRRAAEKALWDARPGEPVLRSLRSCKRQVEAEIKKHLARVVGAASGGGEVKGEEELLAERHQRMCATLRKAGREREALAEAVERVVGFLVREVPRDLTEAGRQEEAALLLLVRSLPYPERRAVLQESKERRGVQTGMSARVRKLARRFHTFAAVRRALSLPAFW